MGGVGGLTSIKVGLPLTLFVGSDWSCHPNASVKEDFTSFQNVRQVVVFALLAWSSVNLSMK